MNTHLKIDEPLQPPDEAQLVAYLDGELPAEQARQVEQRMADDPACRARVRELQRAWDLLDELPRASARTEFARSTIEMVAQQVELEAQTTTVGHARRRQLSWLIGVAGVAVATLLGYLLGSYVWKSPDEQLLTDLPVIENIDHYLQAGDVEFLRMLERERLFDEEPSDAP
ncbi:MAG: anti-sigma factor family protein [Planctomycetota bacterium]